ncbi:hypothetical protein QZJ86_01150 [Methylomonas montana]|uniref:hypothetical protein n=1 Tax=Methylomonas montana TaxID=3058963 RepID=UPI002659D993|nr:hypothetical protein [Methylomonas montana]WKJ90772.1 hypothetical protein QZJ86_01150 [Methylomonas montana]
MEKDVQPDIRLCAQRALWGRVPCSLRAFSVEVGATVIHTRSIFDETATDADKELLSEAGAEIIADFAAPFRIEEEFLVIPKGQEMYHLPSLIFLHYEP